MSVYRCVHAVQVPDLLACPLNNGVRPVGIVTLGTNLVSRFHKAVELLLNPIERREIFIDVFYQCIQQNS